MRKLPILTPIVLALAIIACAEEETSGEASAWYQPWFIEPSSPTIDDESEHTAMQPVIHQEEVEWTEDSPLEPADLEPTIDLEPAGAARLVTITVRRGETIQMYSGWSEVSIQELTEQNEMGRRRNLRIGRAFRLHLTPQAYRQFMERRAQHFTKLERDFFARYEVVRLLKYTVQRGDNIWKISRSHGRVPPWVLERFNATNDLSHLQPGEELLVPVLTELAAGESTAAEALWADGSTPSPDSDEETTMSPMEQADATDDTAPGITVRVARNETLSHYSSWGGLQVSDIIRANPGMNQNVIRLGQKIRLPVADGTLASFYRKRRQFNGTRAPANIAPIRPTRAAAASQADVRPPPTAPAPSPAQAIAANNAVAPSETPPDENESQQTPDNANQATAPEEPPAPTAVAEAAEAPLEDLQQHIVRAGETAWVIAIRKYKISLGALRRANPNVDLDHLRVGDVLNVPATVNRPGGNGQERLP